jgi:hypothetical protein
VNLAVREGIWDITRYTSDIQAANPNRRPGD